MMSLWMKWLVRIYPASWRKRYKAEFAALLEDVKPNWRTFFDVLKAAIAMQLGRMNLVAFAGVAGLLFGLCIFLATPNTYVSKSLIRFDPQPANVKEAAARAEGLVSDSTLTRLMHKYQLYPAEKVFGSRPQWSLIYERERICSRRR